MTLSTTHKLAQRIIEELGYQERVVDEAIELASACDLVLTRHDPQRFAMICLVDAESNGEKRFGLDRVQVKQILARCRQKYSRTLTGAQEPATLEIVEVRRSVAPADVTRLHAYGNRIFDTDAIHAFAVDCERATVTTATRWSFWSGRRRFLERELQALR